MQYKRNLCDLPDLTQKELAKKIGVSQQQIGLWEQGLRIPKVENQQKIARALNISMNELTKGVDKYKYPGSPQFNEYFTVQDMAKNKLPLK
jgi:transcriptional regulator with XRE-family HTH domain